MTHTEKKKRKRLHSSIRYDEKTDRFLEQLEEEWKTNRSQAIRNIIKMFMGVMYGNFFALLDEDKLIQKWGETGKILSLIKEDPPESVDKATLHEVIKDPEVLVNATEIELEEKK